MAGGGHCFVEWKEEFVSQERGNRVVHYFLKDSSGESVLAVVGTERSARHMFYVVSEDFVEAYGAEYSTHAGSKWRSRREVVDWLTSMLSKQNLHGAWSSLKSAEHPMNGFTAQQFQSHLANNSNGHNSDIVWSGAAWTCGKQLKHYPAFHRNGITISIQSFVFVMAKGDNRYVAYLEDMYVDKRGQKRVKVRWFHHNQEVKGVVPLRNTHPQELFYTPHSQVISAECVDGPATVLTREHYDECVATFPGALLTKIRMCSRQLRSNKVKPFDLRKLRGYFDQPILSCLNSKSFTGIEVMGYTLSSEEDEDSTPGEKVKSGMKRARASGGCESFVTDNSRSMFAFGSSKKRLFPLKAECPLPYIAFKVDEKIELLCQDSGMRGCWFRCSVVQVSRKQIKVRYDDVEDEDEHSNLEEWVLAFKLAAPDKLGIRSPLRPTIRPAPPLLERTDLVYAVGSLVDVWWSDGWWEGIVTGVIIGSDDILQVYFPGENFSLSVPKRDLRVSREWVGDQWIYVQAKPDILPFISANVSPDTKLSESSTKHIELDVSTSPRADNVAQKVDLATVTNSTTHTQVEDNKQTPLDGRVSGDDGQDNNIIGVGHNDNLADVDDKADKLIPEALGASEMKCQGIELMETTE